MRAHLTRDFDPMTKRDTPVITTSGTVEPCAETCPTEVHMAISVVFLEVHGFLPALCASPTKKRSCNCGVNDPIKLNIDMDLIRVREIREPWCQFGPKTQNGVRVVVQILSKLLRSRGRTPLTDQRRRPRRRRMEHMINHSTKHRHDTLEYMELLSTIQWLGVLSPCTSLRLVENLFWM